MQDTLGHYYYPDPADKKTRVYVRLTDNQIEFRLWRDSQQEVWDKHGWIPHSIIQQAALMYKEKGKTSDPLLLYDESVARALLKNV